MNYSVSFEIAGSSVSRILELTWNQRCQRNEGDWVVPICHQIVLTYVRTSCITVSFLVVERSRTSEVSKDENTARATGLEKYWVLSLNATGKVLMTLPNDDRR